MEGSTSAFFFLGGHIALDFVNTVMVEGGGPVDRLSSPASLVRWVGASSLAAEFGAPAEIDAATFTEARELRTALKAGFDAVVADRPVPDFSLATINTILRVGPGSELRRSAAGGLRRDTRIDLRSDARSLPWLLADAGAELMASDQAEALRRCANHDSCVLMFLDTSRSHTRRWCSMELCGNRNKVAAHSRRRRRGRSEPVTDGADVSGADVSGADVSGADGTCSED